MKSKKAKPVVVLTDHLPWERPFAAFGNQLHAKYRQLNCDETAFPALADTELLAFELDFVFDETAIADFLLRTTVPQETQTGFSDFPLTVYWNRDFYIELLVWASSTTSIHQHGFSGAFKVLAGSSLHSIYQFDQAQALGASVQSGSLRALQSEYLRRGDVRAIQPGDGGLIHSLYHLDHPTITMVVRTAGHKKHYPQYNYYPPYFALDDAHLGSDELVLMQLKLLSVLSQIDMDRVGRFWIEQITRLDLPRVAYIYLKRYYLFPSAQVRAEFLAKLQALHGTVIDRLDQSVQVYQRKHRISKSRETYADADIRFFLALLMNAPDRDAIFAVVQSRFPQADPLQWCADALTRLCRTEKSLSQKLNEALQQARMSGTSLGDRLGALLPAGANEQTRRAMFLGWISDTGIMQQVELMLAANTSIEPTAVKKFRELASGIEEIGTLRTQPQVPDAA